MLTVELAQPGQPVSLCLDIKTGNLNTARKAVERQMKLRRIEGMTVTRIKRSWGIPYPSFYEPA